MRIAALFRGISHGLVCALLVYPAVAAPALAAARHGAAEKNGVHAASASPGAKGRTGAKDAAGEQNAASQKQMAADAKQLVQLAKELKAAVSKSNQNELSLDVVREAAAIEKLAKQVQKNMRREMGPAKR